MQQEINHHRTIQKMHSFNPAILFNDINRRGIHYIIMLAAIFSVSLLADDKPQIDTEKGIRFHPVRKQIEGWTVFVEPVLLQDGEDSVGQEALKMLSNHLQRIAILVPAEPLMKMRGLELWIERNHPTLKSMQYHPGKRWLTEHGHDPRLVKKVHIPVANQLLSRQQMLKHPMVILHELAHAYHDQILGFDQPDILKAFEIMEASGSYEKVLLYTGKTVKHYGLTNHKEYFAEGTEAYFYRNDFFPFVRAELKLHDPTLHDVLLKIWGSAW
jgi:hypothetical protein